jgi:uncharacterized protein (TIGR00255 family)
MIKSMTGFGKSALTISGKSVVLEIRALNSKQLDLTTRIAPLFRDKENEIRAIIAKELERGKIDFSLYIEKTDNPTVAIDNNLAKAYYKSLIQLSEDLQNPVPSDIFIQVLKMPEVITTPKEELSEEIWNHTFRAIYETCDKVNSFRLSEGEHLAADFEKRILLIQGMVEEVVPYEKNRIELIRNNFIRQLADLPAEAIYNSNRLEEEIIYYLEKIDITEEKVRLNKHCTYFLETLNDPESNGKKLGFIIQEIGREVNTMGSKANDINIQQIVVKMKDEIEKMKEQIANIL